VSLRRLWADLRAELHGLQTLELGSALHRSLLAGGVGADALEEWVLSGRTRKASGCGSSPAAESEALAQRLVDGGASVSGGAALRARLGMEGSRDVDVFVRGLAPFASALLDAWRDPAVDVCLYREKPWELFDIAAGMCAWSRSGFSCDPRHEEALRTGVSDVELRAVVHPRATLGRVAKYGRLYGLRFPAGKVMAMALGHPGPEADGAGRFTTP
jgi:hypothetical protein